MRNLASLTAVLAVAAQVLCAAAWSEAHAAKPEDACNKAVPSQRLFSLERYNANITTAPSAGRIRKGDLVEFNPRSKRDPAAYLAQVKARGSLPEWYWVGVNCDKGPDCNRLAAAGVVLESTGTAEWNKTEQRIHDLRHPAAIDRARREMETALRAAAAAGSDLAFRIDNMHDLDTRKFYDHLHFRKFDELAVLTRTWDEVTGRLRKEGVLRPDGIYGLTAHNNFAFWKRWLEEGGTRPLLLRMENPTQFLPQYELALELMRSSRIPFVAIEFRQGHGYRPKPADLKRIADEVSLLVVMENEDNYEDGAATFGPGPRTIVGVPCKP